MVVQYVVFLLLCLCCLGQGSVVVGICRYAGQDVGEEYIGYGVDEVQVEELFFENKVLGVELLS